jgi:hypothetical protein
MIHVDAQPEPEDFDQLVRQPGQAFLALNQHPNSRTWATHSYWTRVLGQLHDSYRGICAYSCHWIPYDTGGATVEHFLPKNLHPQRAYEWTNYRLVCLTLNNLKGVREDILDPFIVQPGWFVIDFPSLIVRPGPDVDDVLANRIWTTITCLGLNRRDTCWKSRRRYVEAYCLDNISFEHLLSEAPFIALELERQDLVTGIREIMVFDQP